ncbi:helix-turn-helix transcriptional regulator [Undibacterium amnicola]|uniref:Helix-turn-helix transcriptional regulator n=1 Tax=Undibacterium amnicola TaxID=1834038 RepID=A0ABR6XT74_9BURK|nr:helix-turn-helix transcriptional regulator [Undibacterium amnicola]MBC3832706.1 helix-turn-helix transcriptional regulator [Undibacterium amnicola]
MQIICDSFGIAVRQLRMYQAISQEELAEKADLNRSYISEIECGKVVPSIITMDKLAVALETNLSDLILLYEKLRRRHGAHTSLIALAA